MVAFRKPGASPPYDELARDAIRAALSNAGVEYDEIGQAYAGFVYGDSTSGQRALYGVGMTGVPVVNVNNNCSTGSTALFLARQAVAGGAADCVLAVGFEQMKPGALGAVFADRPSPFQPFDQVCAELAGDAGDIPLALRYFGGAGREHMQRYGTHIAAFARDPREGKPPRRAQSERGLPQGRHARGGSADVPVWPGVMTRMMACPPTCGAAAAVVVSDAFARRRGLRPTSHPAQAMTTDTPSTFDSRSMMRLVGYDMTRAAAAQVYEASGVGPRRHRRRRAARLLRAQRAHHLRGPRPVRGGRRRGFVDDGDNTYGGRS